MSDFAIRPMQPSDAPFIFRAWLEGYWPHFPGNVVVSKSEFLQRYHRVIERILADPKTRMVVAYLPEKPEALLGFACWGAYCWHWAYVKQAFRKIGICREMTRQTKLDCRCAEQISHWCEIGRRGFYYTPELLREYT